MAGASERLALLITADGSSAIREFQKTGVAAQTSLRTAQDGTDRLGTNLVRVGAGMAAFGAIALVGLGKAAQAAQEEDLQIAKLNNSISQSPELAGASTDAFLAQAAALQDVTKWEDDATIGAQAMLGTFHLTQREIIGLIPLIQDLASKKNMDLEASAKLVGKAMEGNIGALRRMGVNIDATAFATNRYRAVMDGLRQTAGGFAEEEGQTFNGQLAILKNNLGDIEEGVGRGAVTAFNNLLKPVMAVSEEFESLSPGMQGAIGTTATYASVALVAVGSATMLAGSLLKMKAAYLTVKAAAAAAAEAEGAEAGAAGMSRLATAGLVVGVIAATAAYVAYARSLDGVKVDMEEFASATTDQMVDAAEAIASFGDQKKVLEDLFDIDPAAAQRFVDALGRVADNDTARETVADLQGQLDGLNHSAELSALGLDENATSADELAAQMGVLNKAISDYLDLSQSQEEAAAGEAEAQQALFDALVKNGDTFDVNTAAGRENIAARNSWIDAVGAQVTAAVNYAAANGNTEVAQRRANNAIRDGVGDLRAARDAGLITTAQFHDLAAGMRGIPHSIPANVTSNVSSVLGEFRSLVGEIEHAGAVAASHAAEFHAGAPGHAHGGLIRDGEVGRVHGGELVSVRGGVATVTPAIKAGGGGAVDLSDRSIRRLAKEMAMMMGGGGTTVIVRGD